MVRNTTTKTAGITPGLKKKHMNIVTNHGSNKSNANTRTDLPLIPAKGHISAQDP